MNEGNGGYGALHFYVWFFFFKCTYVLIDSFGQEKGLLLTKIYCTFPINASKDAVIQWIKSLYYI